jgi:hypothetical protein
MGIPEKTADPRFYVTLARPNGEAQPDFNLREFVALVTRKRTR